MKGVGDHDLDYLGELKGLKVLEMGDCTNWTSEVKCYLRFLRSKFEMCKLLK